MILQVSMKPAVTFVDLTSLKKAKRENKAVKRDLAATTVGDLFIEIYLIQLLVREVSSCQGG